MKITKRRIECYAARAKRRFDVFRTEQTSLLLRLMVDDAIELTPDSIINITGDGVSLRTLT